MRATLMLVVIMAAEMVMMMIVALSVVSLRVVMVRLVQDVIVMTMTVTMTEDNILMRKMRMKRRMKRMPEKKVGMLKPRKANVVANWSKSEYCFNAEMTPTGIAIRMPRPSVATAR